MTLDKIWEYVNSNKEELKKLGIKFNKHEVEYGDEYHREDGVSYFFKVFGDEYEVGYVYITEDDDDWAQAECYECKICRKNGKHFDPKDLYELLSNYKSKLRDHKINEIILQS
jgi:hypothetical protein